MFDDIDDGDPADVTSALDTLLRLPRQSRIYVLVAN